MTPEQRNTLEIKYEIMRKTMKDNISSNVTIPTLREFIATVQPTIGLDDAVAVKWCGMWLCIEQDGHCHT